VDRLTAWARNGLEAFHGLSLLPLCLVGALGLGLGYRALGLGHRFIRRAALTALLTIAVVAVVRLALPGPFCAVRWPYPIAAFCPRWARADTAGRETSAYPQRRGFGPLVSRL
jgi:hypothetical protein